MGGAHCAGIDYRYQGRRILSKYRTDKKKMDIIAERLYQRQDIWQDRYIYWIAVAVGHILEWIVRKSNE